MPTTQPRVLVVDDEPDTCANLSDILSELGYTVDVAHNGLEALALVRQHPYDVALLDLRMPGMDGVELYRKIKQLRADTVAIIVTAYASSEKAEEALQAGAWKLLGKPVDFSQLMRLLGEAVDQPTVLVVDDDQDLCENMWDILHTRGFRACWAHNLPEAAERIRSRHYSVVLIDMKLPECDGGEVFRLVREANPTARTIIITGHQGELEFAVQRVLSEGADAVCYKPFEMPQLLQTIRQLSIGAAPHDKAQ
jgi:CheY-like chemotaxis protein